MKIITFSVLTLYSKAIIGYGSQSIILGPVTSALLGNRLQRQNLRPHPRPVELESALQHEPQAS